MSDEARKQIEGIMRGSGMSEPEARASYHLGEAHEALREAVFATEASEAPEFDGAIVQLYLTTTLTPHFDALHNVLARCVLVRERPEWWSRPGTEDAEEE
jgi:hypothetical protein